MYHALSGVLTIFCIGFLGFVLAKKGLLGPEMTRALPKFVTVVVLPPYLLHNTTANFEREQLLQLMYGAVIPILSIGLTYALACLLARLLRVRAGRRGIFRTAFASSSALNIGLPINIALFGEASLPYVLLYFFGNGIFFWTVGNYSIAHDGESASVKLFSLTTLKQICSPPLLGFLAGVALVLLGLHLPSFLDKTFKYVGDMAIALSIMYVGIMLQGIKLGEYKLERDFWVVMLGRFVISPLTVLALCSLISVPPMMRNVFIIQSSLPVMMNLAILSGYYKADARFGTMLTSFSSVISLFTIPLYMLLLLRFLK